MRNIFKLSLGLIIATALAGFTLAQDPMPKPKPIPIGVPDKEKKIDPTEKMPTEGTDQDQVKYDVPLLGVQNLASDKGVFDLELEGLKAKAHIKPGDDGTTEIRVLFGEMKTVPKDKKFVVWLISPEKEYAKLGHVMNTGDEKKESEIYGKTPLKDFGLFVTVEEEDGSEPAGKTYSVFKAGGR